MNAVRKQLPEVSAVRYARLPDPFKLWKGGVLSGAQIAYESWGQLNADRSNAILLFTGLSPSAHAASSPDSPEPGWWERMIGPGRAIDTDRYLRDVREFAGQLLRFHRSRIGEPGHRQDLAPGLSRSCPWKTLRAPAMKQRVRWASSSWIP